MKKSVLVLIFMAVNFLSFSGFAQMGWKWGKTFSQGQGFVNSMAEDKAGSIVETGIVMGGSYVTFGVDTFSMFPYSSGEPFCVFVTKTDSSGNYQWVTGLQHTVAQPTTVVTDQANNVYLLGYYLDTFFTMGPVSLSNMTPQSWSMVFLAKISATGNVLWARNVAAVDSYELPMGLTYNQGMGIDSAGNVYISNSFNFPTTTIGTTTLVNSDPTGFTTDIFLAKYDSSGNNVWAKKIGADNFDCPVVLAVTKSGNTYLSGQYYADTITIGSTTLYSNDTVSMDPKNFLAKFDAAGNCAWAENICQLFELGGMTTDAYEDIYLTGLVDVDTLTFGASVLHGAGNLDAFFAKFDSSGNPLFARSAGGTNDEMGYGISVDSIGNTWMSGTFGYMPTTGYTIYFGSDSATYTGSSGADPMFIAEYNSAGDYIKNIVLPGGGGAASRVTTDDHGNLYVAGTYFSDTMVLGADTLMPTSYAIFLAKYRYDTNRCDFMPAPVASFTYTGTYTDTFTYTGTAPYDSVRWYFGDGGTSTLANPVHTYAPGGSYNACVTVYTGCSSDGTGVTYCFLVDVPSGVANITAPHDVVIYPNPATAKLTICSGEQISSVVITDLLGQVVCSKLTTPRPLLKTGGEVISVDVSGLAAGIYFVKVDNTVVGKFVKE